MPLVANAVPSSVLAARKGEKVSNCSVSRARAGEKGRTADQERDLDEGAAADRVARVLGDDAAVDDRVPAERRRRCVERLEREPSQARQGVGRAVAASARDDLLEARLEDLGRRERTTGRAARLEDGAAEQVGRGEAVREELVRDGGGAGAVSGRGSVRASQRLGVGAPLR